MVKLKIENGTIRKPTHMGMRVHKEKHMVHKVNVS